MFYFRRKGWEIPEAQATPETIFEERRRFTKALAAGSILASTAPAALLASGGPANAMRVPLTVEGDPSASLYPVMRNPRYKVEREITKAEINATYNNFYEFGSHKTIWKAAQNLVTRPWMVKFDGLVETPFEIAIDELLGKMKLEERVYRHRCVEAWSMVVPWSGFPLADLVKLAKPLGSAKYLRFETFHDSSVASGQKAFWYPWPYVEGVTMAEADNELAFMVTGSYGQPVAKQHGAPLRLALPWKYGFKHIKSIQRITLTDQRPRTFWEKVAGREYGFWANVNPKVPHPRWSQASERVLGTQTRVPTQLFNGYAEFVAGLYTGMEGEALYK